MSDYYFGAGDAEKRRLSAVEAYSDPFSRGVLRELGVGAGWTCWEVGAGNGSMAYWLAELVGPSGHVLATDIDTSGLEHRPNLEIDRHDVVEDDLPESQFDLIHSRFLLEHLHQPDEVLRQLTTSLRPGGLLVVEDAAGLELLIDPEISETDEVCRAWERAASSVSWNPSLGRYLLSALTECGLSGVQGVTYQRKAPGGPVWEAARSGLSRLHDRVIAEGADREALALVLHALNDPAYTVTGALVAIAWGAGGN